MNAFSDSMAYRRRTNVAGLAGLCGGLDTHTRLAELFTVLTRRSPVLVLFSPHWPEEHLCLQGRLPRILFFPTATVKSNGFNLV
jgi:hypothetical protein